MELSIIIPTLEEEKYLPFLINSIKKQNFTKEYEIIVADGGSKDKTVEIAKSQGCKIIKGGLPARGRNEGAKVASGGLLLFLDADTIVPENSLEKFLFEFKKRNLDIAGFLLQPWGEGEESKLSSSPVANARESKLLKILYDLFYNWPVLVLEKTLPHSAGAILIKKSLYQKIGGFDEKIKIAEDHICSRKAVCFGKFGILRTAKVYYSQRRFERDGLIKTYLKYFLAELHLIFLGPIKSDIFKYDLQSKRFRT